MSSTTPDRGSAASPDGSGTGPGDDQDVDAAASTSAVAVATTDPSTTADDAGDVGESPATDEDGVAAGSAGRLERLRRSASDPTTIVATLVVLFAVGVGIWLRYKYYRYVEPVPDSDESEIGLMARQLLRGEFPLVMRNQPYGGSPFLFVDALSIRVFGLNVVGLRAPTVGLWVANGLLGFAIGRQLGWSVRRAALGGAGVWSYPMAGVFFGSRATMYFVPSITAGLVAILVVVWMERRRDAAELLGSGWPSRAGLGIAGVVAGVALWINPGSIYLTLPLFAWIGWRGLTEAWALAEAWPRRIWQILRPAVIVGTGFVVGAFPWLFLTVLGPVRRDNYDLRDGIGVIGRGELFFREQLPGWLGFKVPIGGYTEAFWLGGWIWQVGFVALLGLFVFQLVRRGRRNESLVVVLVAAVPIVFLLITSRSGPVYANLRYVFFASPSLALMMVSKWRNDLHAALALLVLPAVALVGSLTWDYPASPSLDPVVEVIEESGARCALGDYWAGGHRLMFASDERIVAATTYENRNPLYVDQAEHLGNCPWVFVAGSATSDMFAGWLTSNGIGYEVVQPSADVVVYFPERRVWLDEPPASIVPDNG